MPNIKISNRNLMVLNQDLLDGQTVAHLIADTASGSGSITVDNIRGFTQPPAADLYVLIGNFGEKTAEIIKLHASTAPTGSTVTLAANTAYDHYTDTPVTVLQFNQVEFSRATTLTGSKSVTTTVSITADDLYTSYTDVTNSTGYAFARYKNSTSTTYSSYSTGVAYATGNVYNSFEAIATEGCSIAGTEIGDDYSKVDQLLRDANEAQGLITQMQDWSFELVKADTAITSTENENTYALSSLTYTMKYPETYQSILNARFADGIISYIDPDSMDEELEGTFRTTLNADVLAAATSFTVTDSYELPTTNGTVYCKTNTILYTTNTKSTGTLSGATGTTVAMSSGDSVWYGVTPGTPTKYTVFAGEFILNIPVSSTEAGKKIKLKYLKKLDRLTDFASVTAIPFYNALSWYMAHKIQLRKGNKDDAQRFLDQFYNTVKFNMETYRLPVLESESYYSFSNKEEVSTDD